MKVRFQHEVFTSNSLIQDFTIKLHCQVQHSKKCILFNQRLFKLPKGASGRGKLIATKRDQFLSPRHPSD